MAHLQKHALPQYQTDVGHADYVLFVARKPVGIIEAKREEQGEKLTAAEDQLTALVSLIRRVCGIDKELSAFDKTIDENFKKWIFKQNTGQHNRFTREQMDWLRMIKDHVVTSCY